MFAEPTTGSFQLTADRYCVTVSILARAADQLWCLAACSLTKSTIAGGLRDDVYLSEPVRRSAIFPPSHASAWIGLTANRPGVERLPLASIVTHARQPSGLRFARSDLVADCPGVEPPASRQPLTRLNPDGVSLSSLDQFREYNSMLKCFQVNKLVCLDHLVVRVLTNDVI